MRYVVIAAGWLWGLFALLETTDAGIGWFSQFILFLAGGLVAISWLSYSSIAPQVFKTPRIRWLWLSVPLIGLCGLFLSMTLIGLTVRVWLCESALREYAESVLRNPEPEHNRKRVGLFVVRRVCVEDGQVMLHTAPSGFMDSAGVLYRPDGMFRAYPHHPKHLFGPWWWFWEDF